jgi:hypothetical protein
MSRSILLSITLGIVLFAGWIVPRSCGRGPEAARDFDASGTSLMAREALLRYQQCQPQHWRYVMLNR